MGHYFSLFLLLACAFPIILAAPSSSAYVHKNVQAQLPTGVTESKYSNVAPNGNTNDYSKTDRTFSGNGVPPGLKIYAKDENEEKVAMCEAGFVGACYSAVEAGKSEANQFTTDNLDTESTTALPSTGFLVATFGAFCILAIIRGSLRRDASVSRPVTQAEAKK